VREIIVKKARKKSNWLQIIILFALLFAALGLVGCGSEEPAPVIEEGSAEVEIAAAEVEATEAAAVVDEVDEVEEEVAETAVVEPTDECLACHIDKEMLIATADPIEEVISENEGEG
jgi:hypothetical protein